MEEKKAEVLTHEESGEECLAGHFDGYGACYKCKHCRVWIRPQHMAEECPARAKQNLSS